jgi:hypothetical protein
MKSLDKNICSIAFKRQRCIGILIEWVISVYFNLAERKYTKSLQPRVTYDMFQTILYDKYLNRYKIE